jgi:hypothetical protein
MVAAHAVQPQAMLQLQSAITTVPCSDTACRVIICAYMGLPTFNQTFRFDMIIDS